MTTFHWIPPPPPPTLKINVHGTFSHTSKPNGNDSGIGAIYRNSQGKLELLTVGTIPYLTKLGNQLWAIFVPLSYGLSSKVIVMLCSKQIYDAYMVVKNFHLAGAPASVYDIASQIDIRMKDKRWKCKVAYVYPARGKVARFLARLGLEVCDRLYTFDRPVGGVEELLNWDMGLGIDHPDFQDVYLPKEAMGPVNFDIVANLSDQLSDLGLGQKDAPQVVNLDVARNADVLQAGAGMEEDFFHGGVVFYENQVQIPDFPLEMVD